MIQTDVLIIGSGLAGLSLALKLSERFDVAVVTKDQIKESNTNYAQGGIASVVEATDHFDFHLSDTLATGSGLTHKKIASQIIKDGPKLIKQLIDWGVEFSRAKNKAFDLGREGGHSHRRILHAGDITGAIIERALIQKAKQQKNIRFFEYHSAIDLITASKIDPNLNKESDRCLGAYIFDRKSHRVETFQANTTVLATGGAGKVYLYTSNPDIATGDGLAMAYRAGAKVANLEFVQFHPTCLYSPQAFIKDVNEKKQRTFLISEALRGEGARLINKKGQRFMKAYHANQELAPRDIVARAIDDQMKTNGDEFVFLDISHQGQSFLEKRFPNILQTTKEHGFDMATEPIPVVPAAHYMCGGVCVDQKAKTSIQDLFAIGEVAHTGLHGANRLASNSLLEAMATANYAAKAILAKPSSSKTGELPLWDASQTTKAFEKVTVYENWQAVRRLMWNYVGIVRSDERLLRAQKRLEIIFEEIKNYYWKYSVSQDLIELRNLAQVAKLTIECALKRKESRGLHFNSDYPKEDPQFLKDTVIFKADK